MPSREPERPEGGWKIHERQLQDLHDWMKRERFLPGPGIIETPQGKRFQPKDYDRLPQFHPMLVYGDETQSIASSGVATDYEASNERQAGFAENGISTLTRLAIRLGYVFGPWKGGGSNQQIANIQQWVFEPRIGETLLSAARPPTLQLTAGMANYIYLRLDWLAHSEPVGGHTYDTSSRGFKAHHKLHVAGATADQSGGSGDGSFDSHRHALTIDATSGEANHVGDGNVNAVGPQEPGIILPLLRRYYYIDKDNPPAFIVRTDEEPPTELETRTFIPAGYVTLNENGLIEGNGDINGFRWFLEGPVYARREPIYVSDFSTPDNTEPTPIAAPEGMEMPGSELL